MHQAAQLDQITRKIACTTQLDWHHAQQKIISRINSVSRIRSEIEVISGIWPDNEKWPDRLNTRYISGFQCYIILEWQAECPNMSRYLMYYLIWYLVGATLLEYQAKCPYLSRLLMHYL